MSSSPLYKIEKEIKEIEWKLEEERIDLDSYRKQHKELEDNPDLRRAGYVEDDIDHANMSVFIQTQIRYGLDTIGELEEQLDKAKRLRKTLEEQHGKENNLHHKTG